MKDLKYFQDKIKYKRKSTTFRDFLKEIASWTTVVLHKNNGIISKFPQTDRIKSVIPNEQFENNREGLVNYGIDYDFEKTFFENYSKLFKSIDMFNFINYGGTQEIYFSDMVMTSRKVYLCSGVINDCENINYSFSIKDNCINIFNSVSVYQNSNNIYFCSGVLESYKIFYSRFINNSSNIWFSSNLTGCSECIFCNDLDNCSYYIENKKYEKEEYLKKKAEILKNKDKFLEYYKKVDKVGKNNNSINVEGSGFFNSQDLKNAYYGYNVKNGNNLFFVGGINGAENMYDVFTAGSPTASDLYGVMGANGENVYLSMNVVGSSNIYYSYFIKDCSYCLGCIGLKNKSYCILNKQYTKDDWYVLANKIFEQMQRDEILGNFFPGNLSPYYFNDTIAGLVGDFTKQEVEKDGFLWRDEDVKVDIPDDSQVIYSNLLPPRLREIEGELNGGIEGKLIIDFQGYDKNGNWYISPEILNKVIKGEKGNYYKVVKSEYDFLMKYELPIPEIHWLDRIKLNFGI